MVRLRVQEIAQSKELRISDVIKASGLAETVVRRYWYNTARGYTEGVPVEQISLRALGALAKALNVPVGDLLTDEEDI